MLLWVRGLLARSGAVGVAIVVAGHGGVVRICLFPPLQADQSSVVISRACVSLVALAWQLLALFPLV